MTPLDLQQKKDTIDLSTIIEAAGVELRCKGKRFVGLCPFHEEKAPSFFVFDDGHYHCFGCGQHGDVINFIRKFHGLSFPDALTFLGINCEPLSKAKIIEIDKARQKQREKKRPERDIAYTLGTLIRTTYKAKQFFTRDNFNEYGDILQPLAWWEYCHDVLIHGDSGEKAKVIAVFKNKPVIKRNTLFKPEFEFIKWLKNFINGEPKCESQRIKISIS